jgi:hypothetical protein
MNGMAVVLLTMYLLVSHWMYESAYVSHELGITAYARRNIAKT